MSDGGRGVRACGARPCMAVEKAPGEVRCVGARHAPPIYRMRRHWTTGLVSSHGVLCCAVEGPARVRAVCQCGVRGVCTHGGFHLVRREVTIPSTKSVTYRTILYTIQPRLVDA